MSRGFLEESLKPGRFGARLNNRIAVQLETSHKNVLAVKGDLRFPARRFAYCLSFDCENPMRPDHYMVYVELLSRNIVNYAMTLLAQIFEELSYYPLPVSSLPKLPKLAAYASKFPCVYTDCDCSNDRIKDGPRLGVNPTP